MVKSVSEWSAKLPLTPGLTSCQKRSLQRGGILTVILSPSDPKSHEPKRWRLDADFDRRSIFSSSDPVSCIVLYGESGE